LASVRDGDIVPTMATVVRSEPALRASLGDLLREWRKRRHQSQLALALEAGISQRHLSFVESGRAKPSREMVLLLAEQLDIPLRERNRLLNAAGFASMFPEHSLDDPALAAARRAIERVLQAHEPYPAIAIDRHWNLVSSNSAAAAFMIGVSPALLGPPMNVLRVSLHPDGMAPRIANLAQWRTHLLHRLEHECELTGDAAMRDLLDELRGYSYPIGRSGSVPSSIAHADDRVFVPLQLITDAGVLSFISTTTVFGTPVDVTISEIALECFFPADEATADFLRQPSDSP
jgi:transcriptional regulator with XRE-family HTH domain